MNYVKNIKFLYLIAIVSISIPLFSGNVNQGMSNNSENTSSTETYNQTLQNNKAEKRSLLKQKYKPKTEQEINVQEKVVNISKLKIPLTALSRLNRIIDSYIFVDKDKPDDTLTNEQNDKLKIDKKEFQEFIESHNLLKYISNDSKNKKYRL